MTILDVDIGNTRLKWRCSNGLEVLSSGCGDLEALSEIAHLQPGRVRISSVCSGRLLNNLILWCRNHLSVEPEVAEVVPNLAGVVCGYDNPVGLGVDRWLAVLAASRRVCGAFLVVDCGTATTVDAVSAEGEHLGGYIVPGLQMMRASLATNTERLDLVSAGARTLGFGLNTSECIGQGVVAMLVSLIELAGQNLKSEHPVRVFITGGAGSEIAPFMVSAEYVESLVLDGLAVALP